MDNRIKVDSIGPDESVIRILHRSWFDIASQYFALVAAFVLLFGIFFMYPFIFSEFKGPVFKELLFFIANTAFLSIWIFGFLIWIDYYFDIWIITSEKIINIEQKGLFSRKVSEIKYEKIQDVTVDVHGILQTVINFGDVLVQTAGDTDNVHFRKISNPHEIKNIIVSMQKKKEHKRTHDFEQAIREGLSTN